MMTEINNSTDKINGLCTVVNKQWSVGSGVFQTHPMEAPLVDINSVSYANIYWTTRTNKTIINLGRIKAISTKLPKPAGKFFCQETVLVCRQQTANGFKRLAPIGL
jgi:hypothetical protein